jgi:hypothetical protein
VSESQDYLDGLADGRAGKDPSFERLALGWNRMNDYERGYVAAGPVVAQHTYTAACDGLHAPGPCPGK